MHSYAMISESRQPKVTIAIPTRNREEYLRIAVESALQQSYNNIEVLISDNCSSDGTSLYLDTIVDPCVRILRQSTLLSMVDNWNACVAEAEGEYFLLLSDDDILAPKAVEKLVEVYLEQLASGSHPAIVYSGCTLIDSDGKVLWNTPTSPELESSLALVLGKLNDNRSVILCSILFRTSDLEGGFPRDFNISNDAAMWMKICTRYENVRHIREQLVFYRIHQKNLTKTATVSLWTREHHNLSELVVQNLQLAGDARAAYIASVRGAIQRARSRYVVEIINTNMNGSRFRGLREYAHHMPVFFSPYGAKNLSKGIVSLLLPTRAKALLKSLKR